MSKSQRRNAEIYFATCDLIRALGGVKEPEICAALGRTEQDVRLAVKAAVKAGWFQINTTGEVVLAEAM